MAGPRWQRYVTGAAIFLQILFGNIAARGDDGALSSSREAARAAVVALDKARFDLWNASADKQGDKQGELSKAYSIAEKNVDSTLLDYRVALMKEIMKIQGTAALSPVETETLLKLQTELTQLPDPTTKFLPVTSLADGVLTKSEVNVHQADEIELYADRADKYANEARHLADEANRVAKRFNPPAMLNAGVRVGTTGNFEVALGIGEHAQIAAEVARHAADAADAAKVASVAASICFRLKQEAASLENFSRIQVPGVYAQEFLKDGVLPGIPTSMVADSATRSLNAVNSLLAGRVQAAKNASDTSFQAMLRAQKAARIAVQKAMVVFGAYVAAEHTGFSPLGFAGASSSSNARSRIHSAGGAIDDRAYFDQDLAEAYGFSTDSGRPGSGAAFAADGAPSGTSIAAASLQMAENVHVLICADTDDPNIGRGARRNAGNLQTLLGLQLRGTVNGQAFDKTRGIQVLAGRNLSRSTLLQRISSLNVTPTDTIMVYLCCHGVVSGGEHQLQLPNSSSNLLRSELMRAMRARGARQVVLVTDSCAISADALGGRLTPLDPLMPGRVNRFLAGLLLYKSGIVNISGSSPPQARRGTVLVPPGMQDIGEFGFYGAEGSFFTNAFIEACLTTEPTVNNWNWQTLFDRASTLTQRNFQRGWGGREAAFSFPAGSRNVFRQRSQTPYVFPSTP